MDIVRRRPITKIKPKFVSMPMEGKIRRLGRRSAKPYSEGVNNCAPATPIDGTGKIEILNPPDNGNSNFTVSYHGGAVIPSVSLELIFWGNAWTQTGTTPTASQIMGAVSSVVSGPYMTGLTQYGIGPGTLRGAIIALSDPPNPFSRDDWHNLIWDLIDQGTFPEPDDDGGRNLYMIIPPPGVNINQPGVCGAHGYPGDYDFPADYDVAWAGYVLNDGSLDTITTSLSHELVEACTDPEDDGWTLDGLGPPSDEIGDICQKTVARVNGVMVQGYWSQRDRACLIPLGINFQAMPSPAVFGRGGPDITGGKKSIYVVSTTNRLAQLWDTNFWNLDFPAEQTPAGAGLQFRTTPAVFDRDPFQLSQATGGKKSIYAIATNGALLQLWDTNIWNGDFPASAPNGDYAPGWNANFRGSPAVFGRGGPDVTGGKKSIYAITSDSRLAQIWDTNRWNGDFPAEAAGGNYAPGWNPSFGSDPAVFSRGGPPETGGKKSVYAITVDGRLAQLWDTDRWNGDFPAEAPGGSYAPGWRPFFQGSPAVFGRVGPDATGGKKSIYAINTDGRLAQLWDTDRWNGDFPAEEANNGQFQNLRFQGAPAVFSRGGPPETGGKKSIYVITTDGRLVQLWDTDRWNLDFPAEEANNGQFASLRFQGSPAVVNRGGPDATGGKKSIYVVATDGRLVQLWDSDVWNLDFPASHF
jgi:hypothetical protein